MGGIGFDCGTYNLVCSKRDKDGKFDLMREVNAFLEIPLENRFTFNMMKKSEAVKMIELDNMAFALGEAAVDMAYTMTNLELKRPMKDGCVNPREKDAFEILSYMMYHLLGNVTKDKEVLYYSVPANAINEETDADYHDKIMKAIFQAYRSKDGFTVDPHPINEGLALVYSELAAQGFTGIGISFGAGMVNLCFAIYGAPVFTFAIVNSGDWIDKMAAKASGENIAYINKEKTKVDLHKAPETLVERAIQTQYNLMIEKTVTAIKKGLNDVGNKARTDKPIDIVIAGGTASPVGFDKVFSEVVKQANLPIKVGNIVRPSDPLYSVARGCLIAAENASH
jgi:hypothetical protein